MDDGRFDALSRAVSSRRTVLGGLLGGLGTVLGVTEPHAVSAHNLLPACAKISEIKRRAAGCRHNRTCHPQPVARTCAPGCGTRRNNCGNAVACRCPSGRTCRDNGSCAQSGSFGLNNCPPGCACNEDIETVEHCIIDSGCSGALPRICTSSAGCPPGHSCNLTACGPDGTLEYRCWPLCPS